MNAETIARMLDGRKAGKSWMARCPAHDDRVPSLSIRDAENGKVLVRCHAGCDQGRVIAALRTRGLWEEDDRYRGTHPARPTALTDEPGSDDAKRTEFALSIWHRAMPIDDPIVNTYLGSRGLHLSPPKTLRFHPGLKHPSGGTWPTIIALVTRGSDNIQLAIHRTFLARDGGGKAPVDSQKMLLGPSRGGAVRLAAPGDVLMVGEGIETCLAAMQETGLPAWAALSTSGLKALNLPKDVRDVIILADGDDVGEAAARDSAQRWASEGRLVRIARPPRGSDFNDVLLGHRAGIDASAT
jgi:putative DNA primase/helicase